MGGADRQESAFIVDSASNIAVAEFPCRSAQSTRKEQGFRKDEPDEVECGRRPYVFTHAESYFDCTLTRIKPGDQGASSEWGSSTADTVVVVRYLRRLGGRASVHIFAIWLRFFTFLLARRIPPLRPAGSRTIYGSQALLR